MSSWYDQQKITANELLEEEVRKKDGETEVILRFRGKVV